MDKLRECLAIQAFDMEDSQMETSLLRSCLSLPKMAYSLPTCPPSYIRQIVAVFEDTMRETLTDLSDGPLSEWSWLKASLPSFH